MIEYWTVFSLMAIHLFADFICQNDEMAIKKSDGLLYLSLHTLIYSLFFIVFGLYFALVTFVSHWCVDFCTSRLNKILWENHERHWFFVVIGVDQFIHVAGLILTYKLLG